MTRVLYVDDEPDIRDIAELALGLDPDFEVRTACSGDEALAILAQWPPDVALLDVMMPRMDGPTLLTRIRQLPGFADLPVIFVTARAQRGQQRRAACCAQHRQLPQFRPRKSITKDCAGCHAMSRRFAVRFTDWCSTV
ncbi:response regulator [Leptolyngbya sp. 15MV]|nr:response regulator [Leptolyngbya sp. 15MV]